MSWVEKHLEKAAGEGYFDDLPGSGQPIADIGIEYSPTWWAARWVQSDAALRDSKVLRSRMADDVDAALALAPPLARGRLEQILAAIREVNRKLETAQQLPVFDVDSVIIHGEWRH
ncbi:MAG: DUF1992 domain-containing protein [bacterium]|nr:DUF1992 domain-containing protein [bacterium]